MGIPQWKYTFYVAVWAKGTMVSLLIRPISQILFRAPLKPYEKTYGKSMTQPIVADGFF
jgi:hypothetical protein